jgi:hypothetical protein
VTAWVAILEPWKGPSYTRRNTPFTVGIGGGTPRRMESVDHLVTTEDAVTTSWEEVELQPEELEDEGFLEECEDNFDIRQRAPKEKKPYQSSFSFDCEDMASPYSSGGERGVLRALLNSRTSRGSSPCGVSSRSPAILTSTPTWCGGRCLGAWKEPHWRIMENLRLQISLWL